MLSSLGYAILALLAARSQSGYDISRQMKPPLGHTWQATHTQIYPELARLAKARLIKVQRIDQGAGPPRRIHAITPAGRRELVRWASEPPQPRPMNDELVVKAYALRRLRRGAAENLLQSQIKLHEDRLAALEQFASARRFQSSKSGPLGATDFGESAALRRAIGSERDLIAWCRWVQREIAAGGAPAGRPKGEIKATPASTR